jgi:hypothetical protein
MASTLRICGAFLTGLRKLVTKGENNAVNSDLERAVFILGSKDDLHRTYAIQAMGNMSDGQRELRCWLRSTLLLALNDRSIMVRRHANGVLALLSDT